MPTCSRLSNSSPKCPASARLTNELGGCDQGADAGEADPGERPQTALVEVDEFIEGVVAAVGGGPAGGKESALN